MFIFFEIYIGHEVTNPKYTPHEHSEHALSKTYPQEQIELDLI